MDNKNVQQGQSSSTASQSPKISGIYSWPVIILVCIVFWPVGLFLLWKRVSVDKRASLTTGRVITICGFVSLAISLMGFLVSISEGFGSDDISTIIFFIIAGAALVLTGNNITKNAGKYKKYLSIIVNQGITSIDSIASASSVSYEAAKKDIEKMIDKGYFSGAYINDGSRELVLPRADYKESMEQNNNEQHMETKVVVCKSCGANNTVIVGKTAECEFCGSPIN